MDRLVGLGFSVEVEDFCDCCPDFEPEFEQIDNSSYGDVANGQKRVINVIRCENKQKCMRLGGRFGMNG